MDIKGVNISSRRFSFQRGSESHFEAYRVESLTAAACPVLAETHPPTERVVATMAVKGMYRNGFATFVHLQGHEGSQEPFSGIRRRALPDIECIYSAVAEC